MVLRVLRFVTGLVEVRRGIVTIAEPVGVLVPEVSDEATLPNGESKCLAGMVDENCRRACLASNVIVSKNAREFNRAKNIAAKSIWHVLLVKSSSVPLKASLIPAERPLTPILELC
jgi:hypothetical protein